MGIIVKPNTFTGQTAPQLPWIDSGLDTMYAEFNGNIDDANIKSNAAIAQSKIANVVTDLANRLLKAGDTMTGALSLKYATPAVRLIGTEASAKDWRLAESAGLVLLQENTGTEASPVWTTRYQFRTPNTPTADDDVSTKLYVDGLTKSLGFGKVVKSDGDVTATTSFVDVTGLSVAVTTGARRARVSFIGVMDANAGANRVVHINLQIDGVNAGGTDGMVAAFSDVSTGYQNLSFDFVTDVLTAASHTFKIQVKGNTGSPLLKADATRHAILMVQELPR